MKSYTEKQLNPYRTYLLSIRNCEELFADARANAGVLFASIPNFTEFYSEDINEGVECIRSFKGSVSRQVRPMLLYIIRKLSL